MTRFVKRFVDGFMFGLGFSLATIIVFSIVAVCGMSFVLKRGFDAVSSALSESKTSKPASGVFLISTNFVRQGDDIVVTAVVTNSNDYTLQNLTTFAELNRQSAGQIDFNVNPLDVLGARSQKEITIVFENVDQTISTSELSFNYDVFEK